MKHLETVSRGTSSKCVNSIYIASYAVSEFTLNSSAVLLTAIYQKESFAFNAMSIPV
jgi:hypothetical protein